MKTYLLDLDGTMYRGNTIINGAIEFLDAILKNGDQFLFLTNNASRTGKQNVEHMMKMGFKGIQEKHFFTSSMGAAAHVARISKKRNAFFVGQDGLKEALLKEGFHICEKDVDFVFVGLDSQGTYEKYSKALDYLLNGARLVGTNSDRLLAKSDGFHMGNGSIVAMFEYASGQKSVKIGKPYAPILDEALIYADIKREDAIMVGDNLETDIKLGVDHGVKTIFVTTGVHNIEDINRLNIQPTQTIKDLRDIQL